MTLIQRKLVVEWWGKVEKILPSLVDRYFMCYFLFINTSVNSRRSGQTLCTLDCGQSTIVRPTEQHVVKSYAPRIG